MCWTRSDARLLVAGLLWLLVVSASNAWAASPSETKGRAHLAHGLELYRGGHYRDAIAEFERGYEILPRPAFLLNIAQAWRKLDNPERARTYFQQFVERASPGDPARLQALSAIDRIDAVLRERAAINEPRPTPAPQPRPPEPVPPSTAPAAPVQAAPATDPRLGSPPVAAAAIAGEPAPRPVARARARTLGFTGVGLLVVGVAGLAAGAGVLVDALNIDDRFAHPIDGAIYNPQLLDQRDLERNLSIGLFAAGGVLTVVGTALAAHFLPQLSRHRLSVQLTPAFTPGGLRAGIGGVF
jgi:hypothetical protein